MVVCIKTDNKIQVLNIFGIVQGTKKIALSVFCQQHKGKKQVYRQRRKNKTAKLEVSHSCDKKQYIPPEAKE